MNKKLDIDYLNYTNLNQIEDKIEELIDDIETEYQITIPTFNKKTWTINELPYIQEIDRIENAIESIGYNFYKPNGWIVSKTWITSDNLYPIRSFDYQDYNRWVNNLELIEKSMGEALTLWNGISLLNWNEESQYEWEEI